MAPTTPTYGVSTDAPQRILLALESNRNGLTRDELIAVARLEPGAWRVDLTIARKRAEQLGITIPRPVADTGYRYVAGWADEAAIRDGELAMVGDNITRMRSLARDAHAAQTSYLAAGEPSAAKFWGRMARRAEALAHELTDYGDDVATRVPQGAQPSRRGPRVSRKPTLVP